MGLRGAVHPALVVAMFASSGCAAERCPWFESGLRPELTLENLSPEDAALFCDAQSIYLRSRVERSVATRGQCFSQIFFYTGEPATDPATCAARLAACLASPPPWHGVDVCDLPTPLPPGTPIVSDPETVGMRECVVSAEACGGWAALAGLDCSLAGDWEAIDRALEGAPYDGPTCVYDI